MTGLTTLTLAADPTIPEAYRTRLVVEPSVTFAPTPYVRVTGGVSLSEMESLTRPDFSQNANSVVTRVDYDQRWYQAKDVTQRVEASYELRTSAEALESDLSYRRHLGKLRYRYSQRDNTVIADVAFGGITGNAPLFERFTRGDGSRSRGTGSTGLGLAIVAAIVGAHGGRVSAESVPGRTVFRIELPARRA